MYYSVVNRVCWRVFPTGRLLHLVVRSDIDQTMIHMQKAIAVDISCVQAYDTIASIEMQRYLSLFALQ